MAGTVRPASQKEFEDLYATGAPKKWDIGRPQPAFTALAESGAITGRVIDVGCGTGEHVLMLAARGFDVTGVDASVTAIEMATAKARDRGLTAPFVTHDALRLTDLDQQFDTVLDSGLFHVFLDGDRPKFAAQVHAILRPGGHYYLLCFSDKQAPPAAARGPRRVSREEITQAFTDGWQINSIQESRYLTTDMPEGAFAWMSDITRL
jgi:cyclopropane fatty-acyl-phospholipid synthase-like methyltransferase